MAMTESEKKQRKLDLQLETLRILTDVKDGKPFEMSGKICSRADGLPIGTTCVDFEKALRLIATTGD